MLRNDVPGRQEQCLALLHIVVPDAADHRIEHIEGAGRALRRYERKQRHSPCSGGSKTGHERRSRVWAPGVRRSNRQCTPGEHRQMHRRDRIAVTGQVAHAARCQEQGRGRRRQSQHRGNQTRSGCLFPQRKHRQHCDNPGGQR